MTVMKKTLVLLMFVGVVNSAFSQQIFSDNFDPSVGILGWKTVNSAYGGIQPNFNTGSDLTYSGYPSTGSSTGSLQFNSSNGGYAHAAFNNFSSDPVVYASFLISINSVSASDNLVMNLVGSPSVPLTQFGFVVKELGGILKFGLKKDGTSTYAAGDYFFGTTYLIVVKYNSSSRVYSLFVNPNLASEPAATLNVTAHTGSAPEFISQIQFNQYNGLSGDLDGVRVVPNWNLMAISTGSGVLLSESFSGTNPDFFNLGWNQGLCCNGLDVQNPGLNFAGLGTGKAAHGSSFQSGNFYKSFPSIISSGMVYVSFLFDFNENVDNTFYSNLNFYSNNNFSWSTQQGFVVDNNLASLKNGDQQGDVINGTFLGGTSFIVLGYDASTGQFSLWVNPSMGSSTPPTPTLTAQSSTTTSVNGVSIMNMGDDEPIYDEIRLSTNWTDVVAVNFPDPPQVTSFAATLPDGSTNVNGLWNYFGGSMQYLVVRGTGAPPVFEPVDGNDYNVGSVGSDNIVFAGAGGSFNDFVANDGEKYFYKVYAFTENGGSSQDYNLHSPGQEIVTREPNDFVVLNSEGATETSISFSVSQIPTEADGVLLLRAPSPNVPDMPVDGSTFATGFLTGNTTVAYIGDSETFTDTGLAPGTTYNYRLFIYSGAGTYTNVYTNQYYSLSAGTIKPEPVASPVNLNFSRNTSFIDLDWQSGTGGSGEDGYLVIQRAGSSPTNGAPVDGVSYNLGQSLGLGTVEYRGSNIFAVSGALSANTQYFYDIYAYTYSAEHNYYNYRQTSPLEASAFTLANQPGTPSGLTFPSTTNSSVSVSFSSNGSTGYVILRRASVNPDFGPFDGIAYSVGETIGGGTVISVGASTSIVDTGLNPGSIYFYQIFSYNGSLTSSNYQSNPLSGSRITAPANPTASSPVTIGQTSFTAMWDLPSTATSYRLDVSTSNIFSSFVSGYNDLTVGSGSAVVTSLAAATTYYFRVRAVSSTGTSGNSNIITVVTAPANPTPTAATSITQNSFTANWNSTPTATQYHVDVALVSDFSSIFHSNITVPGLSTNVTTGILAGTTYYYRVRASSASGTALSGNSTTITLTTRPPDPTSSPATSMAATSFNANWQAATGATGYQLDVSTVSNFSSFVSGYNSLAVAGGSTITQAVTGLTAGTTYFYRVRAANAAGASGNSTAITALTVPPAPAASAGTGVASDSFTANWATSTSSTRYALDVATTNTFTGGTFVPGYQDLDVGNVLNRNITGLTTGTTYHYRVRGVNASGASASSSVISVTTGPPAPVASAATVLAQTSFTANWGTSATATGYRIDVSTDPGFGSFVGVYNNFSAGNVTTLSITSLTAGTTYHYRVRATSASGTSTSSNVISALTIPPNPTASAATSIAQVTFNANWIASSSATGYRIDVATNSSFTAGTFVSGHQDLAVANVTTLTITNVSPGITYFYRVRAVNASGTSGNSGNGTVTTAPPNPVPLAATSITQTAFVANWSASTTATGYFIDVARDAAFTDPVSGYTNLSVGNVLTAAVNTNLTGGTTYFYRVRASSANGTSGNSTNISLITIPGNPTASAAGSHAPGSFTAHWGAVTGASGYRLDVATANTFAGGTFVAGYSDLDAGNVTSLNVNSGLNGGATYYYRVRAVNASGTSSNSNTISTLTIAPAPVASAAAAPTKTSFTANWNPSTSATSYVIDVSTDAFSTFVGAYNNMDVGNVTSAAVTGLSGGITYSYRVRAVNASGQSVNSNTISQITIPSAPVIKPASNTTTNSFNANWEVATGAVSYRLDVTTDGFNTFVAGYNDLTVTGTQSAVTGLSEAVQYTYRVRAVNTAGTSENSLTTSIVTVPPVPTALAATAVTTVAFTANWTATDGATEYQLDVSADDFATFLSGFQSKTTTAVSETISGLQPNKIYKYRVRAKSSSGVSTDSGVITVVTLSTAPTAIAATDLTSTGFVANWSSVSGISTYELDVSGDNFATMITDYNSVAVSAVSKAVTGLTPGTTYQYRVRAVNASGPSASSNAVSVLTKPAAPVANSATGVGQRAFTAVWSAVTGATDYFLDVSTSATFTTFVEGYNARAVSVTSESMSGLSTGTVYYYRVRSRNASGESLNSNVIQQITIPANPVAEDIDVNLVGATFFVASWGAVPGADSYELDVARDAVFTQIQSNYNARKFDGNANTEADITGLTSATIYRFRVRAVNSAGKSGNSNSKATQTESQPGGSQGISLKLNPDTTVPDQFTEVSGVNVTGGVDENEGVTKITMTYRRLTETTMQTKSVEVDGNKKYSIPVSNDMLDEIGMEYSLTAEDDIKKVTPATLKQIYRSYTQSVSPVLVNGPFAGDRSSMMIFSIPYDLADNNIETIFISLNEYNKKTWRLAHYQNGGNAEYQNGVLKIFRGLGYWFNAKGSISNLRIGAATAGKNDVAKPFVLTLEEGWNQIGNPYPFPIKWSEVLKDNPTVSGVGNLKIYSRSKLNFDNGDRMDVFTGGFVHSNGPVTLNLKVGLKTTAGPSRTQGIGSDLSKEVWEVPLSLKQAGVTYDLTRIGMNPRASKEKDDFDELRLPRFGDYLDITFEHPESKYKNFTTDVLPTASQSSWEFTVQSSGKDEDATIEWDNSQFGDNVAQIFLLDVANLKMINMRSVGHYSFVNPGKKEFRMYYSKDGGEIKPDLLRSAAPYPNPSTSSVSMLIALPSNQAGFETELAVFDMMGRQVHSLKRNLSGGIHELQWDGSDASGNRSRGLYIIRARVNNNWLGNAHRIIME